MKMNSLVFLIVLFISVFSQAQLMSSYESYKSYIRCEGFENGKEFVLDVDFMQEKAIFRSEDKEEAVFLMNQEDETFNFMTEDMCSVDGLVFELNIKNLQIHLHREDFWTGESSTTGEEFTQVRCRYNMF
jgi:hypothetical protein